MLAFHGRSSCCSLIVYSHSCFVVPKSYAQNIVIRLTSIKKKNNAYVDPVTSSDDVSACNSCNGEKKWFIHKCHISDMSEVYGCSKCDNVCVFCIRDEY